MSCPCAHKFNDAWEAAIFNHGRWQSTNENSHLREVTKFGDWAKRARTTRSRNLASERSAHEISQRQQGLECRVNPSSQMVHTSYPKSIIFQNKFTRLALNRCREAARRGCFCPPGTCQIIGRFFYLPNNWWQVWFNEYHVHARTSLMTLGKPQFLITGVGSQQARIAICVRSRNLATERSAQPQQGHESW